MTGKDTSQEMQRAITHVIHEKVAGRYRT